MHVYGMTKAEAGAVLGMIAWGMILGSPLLGYASDKILKSRKKLLVICNLVLVLEFAILNIFPSGLSRPVLYIFFFIFSISASAIVVIGFTTTKELFPVEIAGTSVGTVNLFPFLGGAVFMPVLGVVLDAYPRSSEGGYALEGYAMLLLLLLMASIVSLVSTFFIKETFEA